ncbi:pyridoxamine 5'-phosphate oxidase family protein [Cellulophaga sp. Hel_I_12]|uniref:pyridoxamine 5'-phosphate oxidase family protein n=1 Tax=Cellulophaga sp. Hel_I_12 TaxID=1249972 RepID=UPI0006489190|nr:pyridoxamine 5'-phosphate oxidase family protein [Cellulophaga sp. Hel_I_12]
MKNPIHELERSDCLSLLENNFMGRLGFIADNTPFILPTTYYYDADDDCILCYSSEGSKLDAMRKNNRVSFQVDDIKSIKEWQSVLLFGEFNELIAFEAKINLQKFVEGVQDTISKIQAKSPKFINDFMFRMSQEQMPIVYKIQLKNVTGKFRTS